MKFSCHNSYVRQNLVELRSLFVYPSLLHIWTISLLEKGCIATTLKPSLQKFHGRRVWLICILIFTKRTYLLTRLSFFPFLLRIPRQRHFSCFSLNRECLLFIIFFSCKLRKKLLYLLGVHFLTCHTVKISLSDGTKRHGFRGFGKPRNLIPNERKISYSFVLRVQTSMIWCVNP